MFASVIHYVSLYGKTNKINRKTEEDNLIKEHKTKYNKTMNIVEE